MRPKRVVPVQHRRIVHVNLDETIAAPGLGAGDDEPCLAPRIGEALLEIAQHGAPLTGGHRLELGRTRELEIEVPGKQSDQSMAYKNNRTHRTYWHKISHSAGNKRSNRLDEIHILIEQDINHSN